MVEGRAREAVEKKTMVNAAKVAPAAAKVGDRAKVEDVRSDPSAMPWYDESEKAQPTQCPLTGRPGSRGSPKSPTISTSPASSRCSAPSPMGVVIHSGDTAPNVAEYITTHRYSYHVASSAEHNQLVQTVPLTHRAQHAGREGNDWWGLALSGPDEQDPRSEHERLEVQRVMAIWLIAHPGLLWWCRHSDIKATKRDPGPGFLPSWVEVFGLRWKRGP